MDVNKPSKGVKAYIKSVLFLGACVNSIKIKKTQVNGMTINATETELLPINSFDLPPLY